MKSGFVICSRTDSKRVPRKPLVKIDGKPIIQHLCERLVATGITTIVACPREQAHNYEFLLEHGVKVMTGNHDDPLERMDRAAKEFDLDTVIRVTHDKVFVDGDLVFKALDTYMARNLDYLYSTQFMDGTAFEVIGSDCLARAAKRFKGVEHISYAVKAVAGKPGHFNIESDYRDHARLLIDYPEDLTVIELIIQQLGTHAKLKDVVRFCRDNPWIDHLNPMPQVTVYTCVYNGADYLMRAMESVSRQDIFKAKQGCEYIIVDDHSDDESFKVACQFAAKYSNVKVIRNTENFGLATSSNIALTSARGKYIIRLDADDYFIQKNILNRMIEEILAQDIDCLYGNHYYGNLQTVRNGSEHHDPAGAMYKTRALNHIRFTDGLRGFDGLDLYLRAKKTLKIGYINTPVFFYTQRGDSLSHTNIEQRNKLRDKIVSIHESDRP